MADKSELTESRMKQLREIAAILWIHRFPLVYVSINEAGITVTLNNGKELFFKRDEEESAN